MARPASACRISSVSRATRSWSLLGPTILPTAAKCASVNSRHDRRRLPHGVGFAIDMVARRVRAQPLVAGEAPAIDPVLAEYRDRLFRDFGRDPDLLDNGQGRQVRFDDRAGVVAAERQLEAQWLNQHPQPERRAAAAYREGDAARVQPLDGRHGARGQHLVVRHERAVHIGDDERYPFHAGLLR